MTQITFKERLAQDRRLVVLRSLEEAQGSRLNDSVLQQAIEFIGHVTTHDMVRADVQWLEDHNLVRIEKLAVKSGELWIVHLTPSGEEVAQGRREHPGVRRRGAE